MEKKVRVLAAEDDPVNGIYLKSALRHYGFQTDLAHDGREAVEMWESGSYDVIVMDVQMPHMDGLAATRQIREREGERGGHTPIVAMTGSTSSEDEKACMEAGMDAWLAKPVDLKKGTALLKELLKEPEE
ncbi:response regulator [Geomonas sp. RF6]|uniref:response regulator n=1 Tax=Geomonas sp. RF6 TaxID=2897342 RepID=UPI001E449DEC|nr:response regulator [Geomonas sp. RF6]UFS69966.1 response regulator [Geomonas sp. RF6]